MAYLNDNAFDQGLNWVDTNGTRIDICSQEPVSYAEATTTYTLGNAVVNTGAPTNGDVDGRKVVVPSVTGATVTGSGTATHWALTDGAGVLVATGALSASQAVVNGNTFSLTAINITLRDVT